MIYTLVYTEWNSKTIFDHLQKCIEPDLDTALSPDRPLQVDELTLHGDDGEDLVVVLVVELHLVRDVS